MGGRFTAEVAENAENLECRFLRPETVIASDEAAKGHAEGSPEAQSPCHFIRRERCWSLKLAEEKG